MKSFWKHEHTTEQYKDRVLSIDHQTMTFSKIGKSMPFTVINTRDWVIIIPRTADNKFAMVKQYRVATDEVTLEFPGGAVDMGEDFNRSAVRELQEETGLKSNNLTFLGEIAPNPAIMSNRCYVFFADDCSISGGTDFDDFEDIEIIMMDQNDIEQQMRDGKISHSIVLAAYNLFKLMK